MRAFYRKEGRIKYISHLDMNRCVSRDLKRSGLPVWHTLGFNPHIYVTFPLPLSLGYESICESFDFRLTEEFPLETARERLNEVLPEGLTVYALSLPEQKPEAIAQADYEITQEFDDGAKTVADELENWLNRSEILLVKKTKKGEKEVDVKPHFILRTMESRGNVLQVSLRCSAGPVFNLNPTLLLDAFAGETGNVADWMRVVRTAILNTEGAPWR